MFGFYVSYHDKTKFFSKSFASRSALTVGAAQLVFGKSPAATSVHEAPTDY